MADLHDVSEGDQYFQLPVNKPRHIVFVDEAIGKLVRVARVYKISVLTPDTEEASPSVSVELGNPDDSSDAGVKFFVGQGPTVGHALRDMLDQVNEVFPLGGEYDDPIPPNTPEAA